MKKLVAISLICLLFFNWYGFRIVTDLLSTEADQQLESKLDNNLYDESQLIEVKVPLNVPYQNVQSEFERHYGEVEVNGVYYTYVKSKVESGYLVLKCIPNDSKKMIRDAGSDYYKMSNGLDQDHPDKKTNTSVAKQSIGDFDDQLERFIVKAPVELSSSVYVSFAATLVTSEQAIAAQPPELHLS